MLKFIYSSWQQMFSCEFSSNMTGQFTLLVAENFCQKCLKIDSQINMEDLDPRKTTIKTTAGEMKINGEMVIIKLETNPAITAIVKLPCGAVRSPWKPGAKLLMEGELQFQTTAQPEFLDGNTVTLSDITKISTCPITDDFIASVKTKNILTCLSDKNST